MSTPNSICSALIVYGSFAPGRADHHRLDFLPGQWVEGGINASPEGATDCTAIKIGHGGEMPAWVINFADDPDLMSWDEGYDQWARLQWERWKKLDQIFDEAVGEKMVRSSTRWWPATEPDNYHSINIYKCARTHPYAIHQHDPIHPDDRHDVLKLWQQTVSGEFKYEDCTFSGFINDLEPSDFREVFGMLPKCDEFIKKLELLFSEQTDEGMEHPGQTGEGKWRLYFAPGKAGQLTDDQLIELVREIVLEKIQFVSAIKGKEVDDQVRELCGLRYEIGQPPEDWPELSELFDIYDDILLDAEPDDHWFNCLRESCYSIANSSELRNWLLSPWLSNPPDKLLGLEYLLWQSDARFDIRSDVCVIYREE